MANKAKAVKKLPKTQSRLDGSARLKATAKAVGSKLEFETRALACHGKTVAEAIRKTDGPRYRLADLRYDMKAGRVALLKKGESLGPKPKPKADRPVAPKSGQPMPKATLDEFFQFLSCQLQIQSREHCDELPVKDKAAAAFFPQVDMHVKPNLGNTERWVPYHTVLGVHELFLMEAVHSRKDWTEKQKFFAIFVFRAHCKRDLFTQAQLPLMLSKTFWKDPRKAFEAEGPMELAIRAYRAKTKKPLLTNCFRIIPERILKDDDQNLVRSIVNRSARLMGLAEKSFEVVKNKKLSPKQKLSQISEMIQNTEGCGNTWAKMLTVCIDLAYPQEKILDADCDVGVGAAPPLQCLLEKSSAPDRAALRELLKKVNTSHSASAKHFWTYLAEVEAAMGKKFKHLPLVVKQAQTKVHAMSAATLQVQLCEYRQFRHSWARNVYGLPDDETMRMEDSGGKARPEDLLSRNKTQVLGELEHEGKQVKLLVTIKDFGSAKVAERVAMLMLQKLRSGTKEKDLVKFRDDLARDYQQGVDVKEDSEAWKVCKAQMSHSNPLVSFEFKRKDGSKFPFQTTVKAAGHILVAERIARLCWEKLNAGKSKDEVLKFRDGLYASQSSTAKKRKRE